MRWKMKAELCFCMLPCVKQPQGDKSQVVQKYLHKPVCNGILGLCQNSFCRVMDSNSQLHRFGRLILSQRILPLIFI